MKLVLVLSFALFLAGVSASCSFFSIGDFQPLGTEEDTFWDFYFCCQEVDGLLGAVYCTECCSFPLYPILIGAAASVAVCCCLLVIIVVLMLRKRRAGYVVVPNNTASTAIRTSYY